MVLGVTALCWRDMSPCPVAVPRCGPLGLRGVAVMLWGNPGLALGGVCVCESIPRAGVPPATPKISKAEMGGAASPWGWPWAPAPLPGLSNILGGQH